jgi:aerobic C4-dicarboxylate transport protein
MATSPHNQAEAPAQDAPVRKKDRTHWLYIMVIVAVFAGAAIGLIAPEAGIALKPAHRN